MLVRVGQCWSELVSVFQGVGQLKLVSVGQLPVGNRYIYISYSFNLDISKNHLM